VIRERVPRDARAVPREGRRPHGRRGGGEPLADAEEIIEEITDQQSVRTTSKRTIAEFGIRKGDPIGVKGDAAGRGRARVPRHRVGTGRYLQEPVRRHGEPEFRGSDHTDFPSQEYDPNIGIYGLDVTTTIVRPGYRVSKRDKATASIPSKTG